VLLTIVRPVNDRLLIDDEKVIDTETQPSTPQATPSA